MELTVLEILYIVLIVFVSIIGTLLSIVLFKVLKVLNVAVEITGYYNKIKQVLNIYSKIPEMLIDKIKEKFSSGDEEDEDEK